MFLLPRSAIQRAHIHSEGVGVGILNLKESEAKKTMKNIGHDHLESRISIILDKNIFSLVIYFLDFFL